MRFGPLTSFDINHLKEVLDAHRVAYEIEASREDVAAIDRDRAERMYQYRREYPGNREFLYIEIPSSALPLVRELLENMGVFAEGGELKPRPEYVCEKCDYVSNFPGVCPKHHRELIEFSKYAEKLRQGSGTRWIAFAFVALVAACFALYFINK